MKDNIIQLLSDHYQTELRIRNEEERLGLPPRNVEYVNYSIPIMIDEPLDLQIDEVKADSVQSIIGLTDASFDRCVKTIRYLATGMEQKPATFMKLDEEEIRDSLLLTLNASIGQRGTSESFNEAGKTDILFTHREHNLFIAECKIWNGIKYVVEGLSQLEGYLSWGDEKAVLIVFYKQLEPMSIKIDETKNEIEKRRNYIKIISNNERGARFMMAHPKDANRKYILELCFFNIYAKV